MSVNETREFIFDYYYKEIKLSEIANSSYLMKHLKEKICCCLDTN